MKKDTEIKPEFDNMTNQQLKDFRHENPIHEYNARVTLIKRGVTTGQSHTVFTVASPGLLKELDGVVDLVIDANLIAAAPELLEALEQTLSCIDQHTEDPVVGPIVEYARVIIAKAKGE